LQCLEKEDRKLGSDGQVASLNQTGFPIGLEEVKQVIRAAPVQGCSRKVCYHSTLVDSVAVCIVSRKAASIFSYSGSFPLIRGGALLRKGAANRMSRSETGRANRFSLGRPSAHEVFLPRRVPLLARRTPGTKESFIRAGVRIIGGTLIDQLGKFLAIEQTRFHEASAKGNPGSETARTD
jgi:hypothetical protein